MIPWLEPDELAFPPPATARKDPNGLLAAGGDLSPERLLLAYSQGIFPWYDEDTPILWWSPDPRAVLAPAEVHVSKSLRKRLRQGAFQITADQDFAAVVAACAAPRAGADGTWILPEMAQAYISLHQLGHAHSIEVHLDGTLVGGLYGIAMGQAFFGESMFSTSRDASKVAFVLLCRQLQRWGFALVDGQLSNPHLMRLGAREVPRSEFLAQLPKLVATANPARTNPQGQWLLDPDLSNMHDTTPAPLTDTAC